VVLTRSLICDDDRFDFLDKLIKSAGKIWYWDHRGVLVIKSIPSTTTPVWEAHSGPAGMLLGARRRLTDEDVYNAVVASGEAVDSFDPPRGVAYDSNPLSPTYYAGRFGPTPHFFSSPAIETTTQARAAAEAELRRRTGLAFVVDLSAVPNAALEPYDPGTIRMREGIRPASLESIRIPLEDAVPMVATTREQSTILITTG
jgi:hypothetical protein